MGGGGATWGQNTTISVCVAIVRCAGRLCVAGSLTPSEFSGSQDPQILPRGGQQAGPVGMNFSIQAAKRSECPSGTPPKKNTTGFY